MNQPQFEIKDLTMAYGDFVVMRDLNIDIQSGEIFVIMGGSGCGKSTLFKHMIGLLDPAKGDVRFEGQSFTAAAKEERQIMLRQFGITFQAGALWTSMTLAENIALPLREYTDLSDHEILEVAKLKLSLVGLRGFEDFLPHEISGGMQKRASLARAMALDPKVLFFDVRVFLR
jgi:phospholipid/cholesterol/gamma-HCH transport system ATP-binding protein